MDFSLSAGAVEFRAEVIRRRTIYELGKARDRAHVLAGLAVAVANLDEIIALIRKSSDPAAARQGPMARPWPAAAVAPLIELIDEPDRKVVDGHYHVSETQAKAILELRLHRLTGLDLTVVGTPRRGFAHHRKRGRDLGHVLCAHGVSVHSRDVGRGVANGGMCILS